MARLALLCLARVAVVAADGDPRCPCSGKGPLYPDGFGVGCATHQLNRASAVPASLFPYDSAKCRGSAIPRWCYDAWCFVNQTDCSLTRDLFAEKNDIGRFYSMATCGFHDEYLRAKAQDALVDNALRVVWMSNIGVVVGSHCMGDGQCDGVVDLFWMKVFEKAGAKIINESTLKTNSWDIVKDGTPPFPALVEKAYNFDADVFGLGKSSIVNRCVYATGMGVYDICVSGINVISTRAKFTNMIPLYSNDYYIFARTAVEDMSPWQAFSAAFAPFTMDMWIVSLLMTLAVCLIMAWQERGARASSLIRHVAMNVHQGANAAFTGGAWSIEPTTCGGRITTATYGFFMFFLVAAYSANLAAFLVQKNAQATTFKSIDDILAQNKRVCVGSVQTPYLKAIGNFNTVVFDGDCFEAVLDGKCAVAVASHQANTYQRGKQVDPVCGFKAVGAAIFSLPVGVPVSPSAFRGLQYYALQLVEGGLWSHLVEAAQPKDQCPSEEETSSDPAQMTPKLLSGPLIITVIFLLAGVFVSVVETGCKKGQGLPPPPVAEAPSVDMFTSVVGSAPMSPRSGATTPPWPAIASPDPGGPPSPPTASTVWAAKAARRSLPATSRL